MRWIAAVATVIMLSLVSLLSPSVYADEFTDVKVNLGHGIGETPTDIINVGAEYAGEDILTYQTWIQDYKSVGLDIPEGSYVGSFFSESLLKFDYAPTQYDSWKGQHSFLFISKNFKFTYEEIMSGATKWTIKLPVLADSILPQGFPSVLDDYTPSQWNNTQDYIIDMIKCYPPKFSVWETGDEVRTNVSFYKNGENIYYTVRDIELTTMPMYLHDGIEFREPDAQCNVYVQPDTNSSKYYIHADEDDNIYLTDDYHNDQNITGYMSNAKIINNRIYIEMNYPIRPEINYTMSFACRLKSNPKVYFTEETGMGTAYTDLRIIELNDPDYVREPLNSDDFRDVLSYWDIYKPESDHGINFTYEEYNKSLDLISGWDIIFEEGYGNGLFGVQKQVRPGDAIAFRPYVEETADNDTLKHLSMMIPFICDQRINPDIFVTYGNTPLATEGGIDYSYLGYLNGKYRWYSTTSALKDYDYDGIPNYLDASTDMSRYGYETTLSFYDFYAENPYFFTRLDNNYDGYTDFDWNDDNNNNSDEYSIHVDSTKPYYTPVMAFNASNNITILNTTETLVIDLDVFNEGSFYSNITIMNHEMIMTVDRIGPSGTYEYNGPATFVMFWRGDGLNKTLPGWSDDIYEDYGDSDTYEDEYGNTWYCRNCLWLNYFMNFTTTNPSAFKWVIGEDDDENYPEEWERIVFPIVGGYRAFFYDTGSVHYGAPVFVFEKEMGPIANYEKPFPWEPDFAPTISLSPYNPKDGVNHYDAYDAYFQNLDSIRLYDNLGNQYVAGINFELKIIGILGGWSRGIRAVILKNINIPTTVSLYVEMWLPKSFLIYSGYCADPPEILDGQWLNGLNIWNVDNSTDYLSMKERPIFSGTSRDDTFMELYLSGQAWNYTWSHPYSEYDSSYNNNLSWIYPGVAPTKMSDSDGINASDYLLFSSRNMFMQKIDPSNYLTYYDLGGDPDLLEAAWDIYKEDGFICYVIFREYANITFLCYDQADTNVKSTDMTDKFYFIGGKSGDWLNEQGNEYTSDPTWSTYHVMNEIFHPYDPVPSWYNYLNLHPGLNAYDVVDNNYVIDRISSGEVWNIDNEYVNMRGFMTMTGRLMNDLDPFFDYYIPRDLQVREFTEVYHFSLWNSASLTDGEWTQVLVKPEYVWTSVPRFDTQINIGNFFITVTIPEHTTDVDAFGGIDAKDILRLLAAFGLFGLAGFATVMKDALWKILTKIADGIWEGLKNVYDGASQVPGWIMGAFTKLVEYVRAFGEWVKQVLLSFIGFVQNLMEELLDFADFALQFVLFIFPFVAFMLVVNYYMIFLIKGRIAVRNLSADKRKRGYSDG